MLRKVGKLVHGLPTTIRAWDDWPLVGQLVAYGLLALLAATVAGLAVRLFRLAAGV